MPIDFEFIGPNDKPALIGLSSPDLLGAAQACLTSLDYKVHIAFNHGDFFARFVGVAYQVVLIEELFDASTPEENLTLQNLQVMPMPQRRHATIILLGDSYRTLHALEAFSLSVHAVVNRTELEQLEPIVRQVVADNEMFNSVYKETTLRVAQGRS